MTTYSRDDTTVHRRTLPPYSRIVKRRTESLFCLFGLSFVAIAGRLVYIQAVQHKLYADKAKIWHVSEYSLRSRRGTILSRDGYQFAVSVRSADVFIHPYLISRPNRDRAVGLLTSLLNLPEASVRSQVESNRKYVTIARDVSMPVVDRLKKRVKDAKLDAVIGVKEDKMRRFYPAGTLASNVLGVYRHHEGLAVEGIEKRFDHQLAGVDGKATALVDAQRRMIANSRIVQSEARDGQPLVLSLDYSLQMAAEENLDRMAKTYRPLGATCTVMDVRTGEIWAMATYPRFDPNKPGASPPDYRRNRAITDSYEPGSTMKTLTVASALDCGAINLDSVFRCAGRENIGGRSISCVIHAPFHGGHGIVDPELLIEHSCNISAAKVGIRMGHDRLREYCERYGLGHKMGIELTGEVAPRMRLVEENWRKLWTANVAFGQGISVTPLQLLAAYGAIANGGEWIQPTILKRSRPVQGRRILKRETCQTVLKLLRSCVVSGTGKSAKVRGYAMGGKTGSAQKVVRGMGYNSGKFIASFAAVVPITNPRFVILTTVDEPKGSHWGATVAAPVVREVTRQAVIEMGVPPTDMTDTFDGSEPRTWRRSRRT